MADETSGIPKPSEKLAKILAKAGAWKVSCKYYIDPTGQPIEAEGTNTVDTMGEYWSTGRFSCTVMGSEIRGLSTTGYDPIKEKFVGTWQDSSNPYFYYFEGNVNDDGVLEMEGDNIDPMTGNLVKYRSVESLGDDEYTLELYVEQAAGKETKILEYRFTRA